MGDDRNRRKIKIGDHALEKTCTREFPQLSPFSETWGVDDASATGAAGPRPSSLTAQAPRFPVAPARIFSIPAEPRQMSAAFGTATAPKKDRHGDHENAEMLSTGFLVKP
jgi:hypothetical protein